MTVGFNWWQGATIVPKKFADLILVDGDPTRRISDIRRSALVIRNGETYERAALYEAIGVWR